VHSSSSYYSSIAFPAIAELCLRVSSLGKSSVTYEIALFEKGMSGVKAVGKFIHVFVDRGTGRPSEGGMSAQLREGLQRLVVREGEGVGRIPEMPGAKL
jgi:acyl-CoA thioester hydrolase